MWTPRVPTPFHQRRTPELQQPAVQSEVFDPTVDGRVKPVSPAIQLEPLKPGEQVTNLTSWRRSVVGDLTSTLGFSSPNDGTPQLPATALDLATGCPTLANPVPFLAPAEAVNVPVSQQMPTQEPGQPRRR